MRGEEEEKGGGESWVSMRGEEEEKGGGGEGELGEHERRGRRERGGGRAG